MINMKKNCYSATCLEKQEEVKRLFSACSTPEQKYEKIIALGMSLPPYPKEFKTPKCTVAGCQSIMYLHTAFAEGKLHFSASSEALISAGLAALLIFVYQDEPPETLLTTPPLFLDELGIPASLSPSRSNGLASLYAKMQKEALQILTDLSKDTSCRPL